MADPHINMQLNFISRPQKVAPRVVDIWCGDEEAHAAHDYPLDRAGRCEGVLPCGERIHEPHDMVYEDNAHCLGICKCGTPSRMHSPHRHTGLKA